MGPTFLTHLSDYENLGNITKYFIKQHECYISYKRQLPTRHYIHGTRIAFMLFDKIDGNVA